MLGAVFGFMLAYARALCCFMCVLNGRLVGVRGRRNKAEGIGIGIGRTLCRGYAGLYTKLYGRLYAVFMQRVMMPTCVDVHHHALEEHLGRATPTGFCPKTGTPTCLPVRPRASSNIARQ